MTHDVKYPVGLQSFPKIREGNYVYVDKTEYIHRLINNCQYVFLSRPRRFGKSLLLSTIEEFFKGNKKLFEGLAISQHEHDWQPYAVLHLDFTGRNYNDPDSLDAHLNRRFEIWEEIYGKEMADRAPEERFQYIIARAKALTGRNVVILIDEYDKPLLETVDNPELQQTFRNKLRGLFGNLKSMDAYIRFAILTGVTKFGHLSIFSDLNNLKDISLNEEYNAICGLTEKELKDNFHSGVEKLADKLRITTAEAYGRLRDNYDGYHFSPENALDIYNPFSIINCLDDRNIGNYWFKTGTPTFLIKMIKDGKLPLTKLNEFQIGVSSLTDVSIDLANQIPVLYQSGYLTIKNYEPEFDLVTLGFPNKEVEAGFFNQLMGVYTSMSQQYTGFEISQFVKDIREGKAESFMLRVQSLYADFQYDSFDLLNLEQHYQDVIFIVMKLLGLYVSVEYKTANGRIDMVVRTTNYIYIFEFKIDKTPQEALAQIYSKGYLLPFTSDGRQLIKIGVNFSSKLRGIEGWIVEEG